MEQMKIPVQISWVGQSTKEKENLEVDIFGGEEKKNVKGKGGKYSKREYTFLTEEKTNWGGKYLEKDNTICGGKKHGKGKYFFAKEKEKVEHI